jgi:hypothetical protein
MVLGETMKGHLIIIFDELTDELFLLKSNAMNDKCEDSLDEILYNIVSDETEPFNNILNFQLQIKNN